MFLTHLSTDGQWAVLPIMPVMSHGATNLRAQDFSERVHSVLSDTHAGVKVLVNFVFGRLRSCSTVFPQGCNI